MNQTTRRFPRTMQAAFGPYTDNVLHPMPDFEEQDRETLHLWVVLGLGIVALLVIAFVQVP